MDGVVVIVFSLILYLVYRPKHEQEQVEAKVEKVDKNPLLNPEMYVDEHAFMTIANELGFH